MEEALSQVLGRFILMALAPEKAINGLPILLQQEADETLIAIFVGLNAFYQGPLRRQKGLPGAPEICLITITHCTSKIICHRPLIVSDPPAVVLYGLQGRQARGTSAGDDDNDGFLDLVLSSSSGNDLYHNNGNANHWLILRCVGTESIVMEVGTLVNGEYVTPTEGSQPLFEMHMDGHEPVLAPPYDLPSDQRRQLTLDDFGDARRTMDIQETLDGTRVTLDLSGLIPQ